MLNGASISALLIIAVAVWGASLWILGIELTWDHAKPYSLTLAALTTSVWLFENHLWKRWPFRTLVNRVDLGGTWRVELQSSFRDPKTGALLASIAGYAAVRQSYSNLSIRLMTAQAESFLIASNFDVHGDGTTYVYGVYQSDPSILLRGGISEIHYGSFKYKISRMPVLEINGHYWTDRQTNGSIRLFGRLTTCAESYSAAAELYNAGVPEAP